MGPYKNWPSLILLVSMSCNFGAKKVAARGFWRRLRLCGRRSEERSERRSTPRGLWKDALAKIAPAASRYRLSVLQGAEMRARLSKRPKKEWQPSGMSHPLRMELWLQLQLNDSRRLYRSRRQLLQLAIISMLSNLSFLVLHPCV